MAPPSSSQENGKSFQQDVMMKQFMEFTAMLKKNGNEHHPPTKLLNLAGQLCQELQSSSPSLEKLVEAMMGCKNKRYFLTNIHVVRACVSVYIHKGQHDAACSVLECCKAEEKEELVQLWHEIHYRRVMEKQQTDFLTPLQKFRCRKRNPPPISLCPEGLKSRNYSEEVRQHLYRFAAEVTAHPNKKQRERLAQDMNLQPIQVYNWFANYRRRQKSRLRQMEEFNNSCPQRPLASHTNEPQDKGSHTPQTADGSCVGISPERVEITLMPCEPGWKQAAAPLYKPPGGTHLKMLEPSCMQSPELYEAGTRVALFTTHSTEQPVPLGTEAVMEPGTCFGSPVLLPGEGVSRAAASSCQGSFALCSYESLSSVNYWLPVCQASYSPGGVSGSMWTPGVEAGIRVPLSTIPQGGCVEASSERIIQQSDLQDESLILRGEQLGTPESIPHSSSQTVFGKPQCPPVSAPCVEESQALGQSQVLEDPVVDSLTNDMFQAARLLYEFSAGGQM